MVAMFSGFPKKAKGYHWRLRKTRKDAGKAKWPAQQAFRKAVKACPYPKTGGAKARRAKFNACIKKELKSKE